VLKIGDFSKLAHVTVKTLRHYARMGLIKPAWIDRYTGYRYYSLSQLPRLNRILALKDMGFSLEQVAGLLDERLTAERLRELLRQKQGELEERLKAEQNRLRMVAARLQQIEQEGCWSGSEVVLKRVEAAPFASLHGVAPGVDDLPGFIEGMLGAMRSWLDWSGVRPAGPWMALYSGMEYRERNLPVELGVVVEAEALRRKYAARRSDVSLRVLPAVERMASLVHAGSIDTLAQAYTGLYTWIEANHQRAGGPARELYLRDEAEERSAQVIEVQLPLEREPLIDNLTMNGQMKEQNVKPQIVTRPAFNVVGMCYHGRNQNQEIGVMWSKFLARLGEIERINPTVSYGVCTSPGGLPEGHFEYVSGVEVPEGAPVPEGMVLRTVPAQRYAAFKHIGSDEKLGETYRAVYQEWMPAAGLEPAISGWDMEVYTEEFDDFSPESVLYIYVPVK
jgi:predicted transcriptional regulator YdeE/DNA-binding transcriptional MerR regulator